MSKQIEIPLDDENIKSVPARFPDKCIYCGAPKQTSTPRNVTRHSGAENAYDMEPIDIPYCNQHFNEIKTADARSEKVASSALYISLVAAAILLFIRLYEPIYNWGFDALNEFRGEYYSMIGGFIATVVTILFLTGGIGLGISFLARSIAKGMMKPPEGIKTSAFNSLQFNFRNEQIADEFLALNKDLGAREYSFKQTFKEAGEIVRQSRKEAMAAAQAKDKKSIEAREVINESVVESAGEAVSPDKLKSRDESRKPQKIIGWILAIVGFFASLGGILIFTPIVLQLSDPAGVSYSTGEIITAIACLPLPLLLFGLVSLLGGVLILRRQGKRSPK